MTARSLDQIATNRFVPKELLRQKYRVGLLKMGLLPSDKPLDTPQLNEPNVSQIANQ